MPSACVPKSLIGLAMQLRGPGLSLITEKTYFEEDVLLGVRKDLFGTVIGDKDLMDPWQGTYVPINRVVLFELRDQYPNWAHRFCCCHS